MDKKYKIVFALLTLTTLAGLINLSANAKAQHTTYDLAINKNDEYVWKITELNLNKFKYTFGSEPNFKIGDQIRIIIRDITEVEGISWSVTIEFWDYGTDWNKGGNIEVLEIYKLPAQYQDYIFIPVPVEDYLSAAIPNLPTEYYALGATIGKRAKSDLGISYIVEKTFSRKGTILSEAYYDENKNVIVKLESTTMFIPLGYSFIGFLIISVIATIIAILLRSKIRIIDKKVNAKLKFVNLI
ncbi:MAG: hypothetical protein ACTSO4_10755 [Promethearchaeota archaeon]